MDVQVEDNFGPGGHLNLRADSGAPFFSNVPRSIIEEGWPDKEGEARNLCPKIISNHDCPIADLC
jgi:hypothetical protein